MGLFKMTIKLSSDEFSMETGKKSITVEDRQSNTQSQEHGLQQRRLPGK